MTDQKQKSQEDRHDAKHQVDGLVSTKEKCSCDTPLIWSALETRCKRCGGKC